MIIRCKNLNKIRKEKSGIDEFLDMNLIEDKFSLDKKNKKRTLETSKMPRFIKIENNNYKNLNFVKAKANNLLNLQNFMSNTTNSNNQQKNNLYIEINIIPYNENKLKNSVEIKNKYSSSNKEYKGEKQKIEKSSSNIGLIIFLIIVFILIALFLSFRYIRKRKISERSEYFKNDFPNYD